MARAQTVSIDELNSIAKRIRRHIVEMTANANNQMQFGRPGRFPRGLAHLGSYEFVPVGAERVRVRFSETPAGMTLTVHDPDVVLTAKKAAGT